MPDETDTPPPVIPMNLPDDTQATTAPAPEMAASAIVEAVEAPEPKEETSAPVEEAKAEEVPAVPYIREEEVASLKAQLALEQADNARLTAELEQLKAQPSAPPAPGDHLAHAVAHLEALVGHVAELTRLIPPSAPPRRVF